MTPVPFTGPRVGSIPSRIVALNWYDGPIGGFAEYENMAGVYRFDLVSDLLSMPRFFAIRASEVNSMEQLDEILKAVGTPRIPVWVPTWHFPQAAEEERARRDIEALATRSGPVIAVVGAESFEMPVALMRPIITLADREMLRALLSPIAADHDWTEFCKEVPPSGHIHGG